MRYYNLANLLSVSRILLTPPIVLVLLSSWPEAYFVGGWLFMGAMATDIVDGYLARRGKGSSSLGVFLDLVADKVLVLAILVLLAQLGALHGLIASVIVVREVVVMALRSVAAARGRVIPAAAWGKGKTIITSIGIAAVILGDSLQRGTWGQAANWSGWLNLVKDASLPLMIAATVLTIVSGAMYVRTAMPVVLGGVRKQPVNQGERTSGEVVR